MMPVSLMAGTPFARRSDDQYCSKAKWATTSQEWSSQRARIKKLYLEEGKTLKEVMHIMSRDHNFRAT
jgi:hypothetical protein